MTDEQIYIHDRIIGASKALIVLPYIKFDEATGAVNLWSPIDHDSMEDGLRFAELTLKVARDFEDDWVIAFVMRDLVRQGRFGATAAGFISRMSEAAFAGFY